MHSSLAGQEVGERRGKKAEDREGEGREGWDWREGNIGEEGAAGSELMRLLDVFNHVETVLYLDSSIILRASLGKTDRTLKNEVSK